MRLDIADSQAILYNTTLTEIVAAIAAHVAANPDSRIEAIETIRTLAAAAAILDCDVSGCDMCNGLYDTVVCDAATDLLPPFLSAFDRNGDLDVTVCPFCLLTQEDA